MITINIGLHVIIIIVRLSEGKSNFPDRFWKIVEHQISGLRKLIVAFSNFANAPKIIHIRSCRTNIISNSQTIP
jgi:hypothetical protein